MNFCLQITVESDLGGKIVLFLLDSSVNHFSFYPHRVQFPSGCKFLLASFFSPLPYTLPFPSFSHLPRVIAKL